MAWNSSIEAQRQADAAWAEALHRRAATIAAKQKHLQREAVGNRRNRKRKTGKLGWFNRDGSVNHALYMRSPDWAERKRRYFSTHRRQCAKCGARQAIQLHHLTYENLGMEKDEDLQPLCETCHNAHHGYAV